MGGRRREGRGGDASVVGAFPVGSRDGGSESVLLRQAIRAYTDQLDKISGRCQTDGDQISRVFMLLSVTRVGGCRAISGGHGVCPSSRRLQLSQAFRERITATAEGSLVHTYS